MKMRVFKCASLYMNSIVQQVASCLVFLAALKSALLSFSTLRSVIAMIANRTNKSHQVSLKGWLILGLSMSSKGGERASY